MRKCERRLSPKYALFSSRRIEFYCLLLMLWYSAPVFIQGIQILFGKNRAVLPREAIIFSSFRKISLHAFAPLIHHAKVEFCLGELLSGGPLKPQHCLRVVHRSADTVIEGVSNLSLCLR